MASTSLLLSGGTRGDGWTGIAALEQIGPAVQAQSSLGFVVTAGMAFRAMLGQHGTNLLLEEFDLFRCRLVRLHTASAN